MTELRVLCLLAVLLVATQSISSMPKGIESGLVKMFSSSSHQTVQIPFKNDFNGAPQVGYLTHAIQSTSVKAIVATDSIEASRVKVNITLDFPDTEHAVFYGLRYVATVGDPFQITTVTVDAKKIEKSVSLGDFNFKFEQKAKLVKFDALLAGLAYEPESDDNECDALLEFKPDWPDSDFSNDYGDFLTKVDADRPYQKKENVFYLVQRYAKCINTVQLSITAFSLEGKFQSGFNRFQLNEEVVEFGKTVEFTSALIYDERKNKLGSQNSTLIFGLTSLLSSRKNVSVNLNISKQSNMRIFAFMAAPIQIRGSAYIFTDLQQGCSKDEVLQNYHHHGQHVLACQKSCAVTTHLFEQMTPPACIQCDQFGANFTYNYQLKKCACDPKKTYQKNGKCICKDHGFLPFETGRECEVCHNNIGCEICFQNSCQRCLPHFDLKKLEDRSVCVVNCDEIKFAAKAVSDSECACEKHFLWHPATATCEIFCHNVVMAEGPIENKTDQCKCVSGVWDHKLHECVFDCKDVPFADKDRIGDTFGHCHCQPKFFYDMIRRECMINCSEVTNSNGTDLNQVNACGCQPRFAFNPATSTCDVNCALIPHSDKQLAKNGTCACLQKFYYDNEKFRCLLDCAKVQNSAGPASERQLKCKCKNNCQWEPIMLTCELKCDWVHNSDKQPASNNMCKCINKTNWNKDKMLCE